MIIGMTAAAEKFRSDLLALPEEDRAELARMLFESLDGEWLDAGEDPAFMEELARREADMLSGKSVPIPYEEAMAQLRAHVASLRQ